MLLRWALQKRIIVIPKAAAAVPSGLHLGCISAASRLHLGYASSPFPKANREARATENTRLFHFSLSEPEMAAIDSLDRGEAGRTCWRNDPLRMLQFE